MSSTATAFTFQFQEGEVPTIETAVFQALGAASTCWDTPEGAGVFHSERAKEIGEALLAFIAERQPMLGYATTHELVNELWTRVDVSKTVGEHWVHYRTVDSE